jgi:hypothetical protein
MQTATTNFDYPTIKFGLGRSLYARGAVWMTAFTGNLNFIAACFFTGLAAVFAF